MTGALGDFFYGPAVPHTPDVVTRELQPQHDLIVLGSDGAVRCAVRGGP